MEFFILFGGFVYILIIYLCWQGWMTMSPFLSKQRVHASSYIQKFFDIQAFQAIWIWLSFLNLDKKVPNKFMD